MQGRFAAGACLLFVVACGSSIAAASRGVDTQRGSSTVVTVSITDGELVIQFAAGPFGSPDVSVDYDPATDQWVVTDDDLVAGASCVSDTGEVRCPEAGEDVSVDFANVPGEVTLLPADDSLNFDSRVHLGSGPQSIVTSNGRDVVTSSETSGAGSVGDDIRTLGGDDEVEGGLSGDMIFGGPGDDTLDGGAGDDTLGGGTLTGSGNDGADTFRGGTGSDTVTYVGRTDDISAGIRGIGGAPGEGDAIGHDVENLTGGQGDDVLKGDSRDNVLNGGDGGDDLLFGGVGKGPDGADTLRPGAGAAATFDTVSYARRTDVIIADVGGGADDVDGDGISADIDAIVGGRAGDALTGDEDANSLVGGPGEDTLFGMGGADTISAVDGGADASDCGLGTDVLRGDIDATETETGCESVLKGPQTSIESQPSRRYAKRTAKVGFEGSSPVGPVTFQCSIDDSTWASCTSPAKLKKLADGWHEFRVRSVEETGIRDPSPARARFKVTSPIRAG